MDYSQLSDDELKALYAQKQQQSAPDYSSMSDEELTALYNQKKVNKIPQPAQLPPPPNQDMESYINQKTEEMPYEPIAYAQGNIDNANGQLAQIDAANAEFGPISDNPQKFISGGIEEKRYIGTGDQPRKVGGLEKFAYGSLPVVGGIAGSIAGLPLGPAGIIAGGAGGAATGKLWKRNLEALRGIRPIEENDAAKTLIGAGQAGIEDAALSALTMGAGKFIARPLIKATAPTVNKLLTSTPAESTKRLLERQDAGVDILKGKYQPEKQFNEIGGKVREGLKFIKKEAGKVTQAEREALQRYKNVKIPVSQVKQQINKTLDENTIGSLSGFSPADTKILKEAIRTIDNKGEKLSPFDMHKIKTALNRSTQFEGVTNAGDTAIKQTSKSLDNILAELFPEYKIANKKYAEIADIEGKLRTRLKEFNAPKNIKTMYSDANQQAGITDVLQELDTKLPTSFKFADDVADLEARKDFEYIFPFSRGVNRSEQEITNFLLRGGLTALGGLKTGGAGYALAPLLSPKVQGQMLRMSGSPLTAPVLGSLATPGLEPIMGLDENSLIDLLLKSPGN